MDAVNPMDAETALRLTPIKPQAANDHLTSASADLAWVNAGQPNNRDADGTAASQTAGLQLSLALISLRSALSHIPAALLMPSSGGE